MVTPEIVMAHVEKLFLKKLIATAMKTIKTIRERRSAFAFASHSVKTCVQQMHF